jgi:hypothetical protein
VKTATLAVLVYMVLSAACDESSIVPEDEVTPMDEEVIEVSATESAQKILKQIISLRAYCISAHDKAEDFKSNHGKTNGLVDFVLLFGKVTYEKPKAKKPSKPLPNDIPGIPVEEPSQATMHPHKMQKKVMKGNVVVDFASAMAKISKSFNKGIGKYVVDHLNKVILKGTHDGLQRFKNTYDHTAIVGFSRKAVGLSTQPDYLIKLAVPFHEYQTKLAEVTAQASDADTAAASLWLQAGGKGAYKSFMHREVAKANAKVKTYNKKVIGNIVSSVKAAYKRLAALQPLPEVAKKFATGVKAFNGRSDEAIKNAARTAGSEWMKKNKKKDGVKAEIKKIEGKAK